jgi:DNA polymerase III subunit epsilon
MTWADQQALALDTETSGVDIDQDRIASACAAIVRAGVVEYQRDWLIAVDVDIAPEASAVNKLTTEHCREHGRPAAETIPEIANAIRYAVHSNMPIVAYNGSFDLSLIDRECRRWIGQGLAEFCGRDIAPVIDVYVLWKQVDRYRKGSRKLTAACEAFGVELGEKAHEAAADAIAATRVACRIAQQYPRVGAMTSAELHEAQVQWKYEQQVSLRDFWVRKANEFRHVIDTVDEDEAVAIAKQELADLETRIAGINTGWPIAPLATQGALL